MLPEPNLPSITAESKSHFTVLKRYQEQLDQGNINMDNVDPTCELLQWAEGHKMEVNDFSSLNGTP